MSMELPNNIVFVRHGQSEANYLQQMDKLGRAHELPAEIRTRPDWEQRLTDKGVKQARQAGAWLTENVGPIEETFEARYHSTFLRARETAAYLGGPDCVWRPHNLIFEQDWGHFGRTPKNEQSTIFPATSHYKKVSPLFAQLDGGEALGNTVTLRMRELRAMARRKWSGKNMLVVSHGGLMGVARYVFEDMLPEQWHEMDKDKSQRIGNCALLMYSRVNPEEPSDVRPYIGWRRMIQPDAIRKSPFGGEWRELPDRRFMTGQQLLDSVEIAPRLLQKRGNPVIPVQAA